MAYMAEPFIGNGLLGRTFIGNGLCAAKSRRNGLCVAKSRLSRLFSWSLQPGNGLFGLAVCNMASTAEEWSFMAE
ncbi:hypothetical protein Bca4012_033056 [Brassica carinata]